MWSAYDTAMPIRRRGSRFRARPSSGTIPRPTGSRRAVEAASTFELAVERAIDGLPEPLRRLLDEVAIVIDDVPSAEQRRTSGLRRGEMLYGLYEGTPPTEYGADSVSWPNKITLFRLPLEQDFPDPVELAEEVRKTLVHELAHHVGFGEHRLGELGLD